MRSISGKFDSITMPTDQFKELNKISLKDLIGTLNVNEDKLKRRSIKRQEKALLVLVSGVGCFENFNDQKYL